jgi:hypothetical protein
MAGGSIAPIENSPPGIHAIPGGGAPTAMVLGMVGAKATNSAAWATRWLASTLLADEGRDARNTTATTAITPVKMSNIHSECLSAELIAAGRASLPFFRFMRPFAPGLKDVALSYESCT